MLNDKEIRIKNGLKKEFILHTAIRPEFSAAHTKLCADGFVLTEEQMYIMGCCYERGILFGKPRLFNEEWLSDLCSCTGIYLEEYCHTDEENFYSEIKRNSAINIAPPMIYVRWEDKEYLAIVCKVHDDHTYDIISPVEKEVITVGSDRINRTRPWYMMNSPRFMAPVFRDRQELAENGLRHMFRNIRRLRSAPADSSFFYDSEKLAELAAAGEEIPDLEELTYWIKALGSYKDIEALDKCGERIKELYDRMISETGGVKKKLLAKIFDTESETLAAWYDEYYRNGDESNDT
ncbi:MAG TPA: hypothetical protein P5191_03165 [Ruminococcus sp.]|nr:hypothetical protein [Ruminococcus sp.]